MVLGIDLSLTGTGIVIYDKGEIVLETLIKSSPTKKTELAEMIRLKKILDGIYSAVKGYSFEAVTVEGVSYASRASTSLSQLSGLNYLIRYNFIFGDWSEMLKNKEMFRVVAPTMLKKFVTGKGNTKKDLMLLETYKRYNVYFEDDNICDAYGLSLIAATLCGEMKVTLAYQVEVIDKMKS